jgi:phage recombination protein Bet
MERTVTDKKDVVVAGSNLPAGDVAELRKVLRSSLYPDASDASVDLVISYCRAAGLDVMQKPVHIVPINVKVDNDWVKRDTIMPGIGLYRTQASRTGQYAGISEPEYGPDRQLAVGDFKMTYPEWCKITIRKRHSSGQVDEFSAKERWLENYATIKRDSDYPNAMWKKRPYAQLAKCAEAQALRKAFPELGAAMTADETYIDQESIIIEQVPQPKSKKAEAAQEVSREATQAKSPLKPDSAAAPAPKTEPDAKGLTDADASPQSAASGSAPDASAAQKSEAVKPGSGSAPDSPSAAAAGSKPMNAQQAKVVKLKITTAGLSMDEFEKSWAPFDQLTYEDFPKILTWFEARNE